MHTMEKMNTMTDWTTVLTLSTFVGTAIPYEYATMPGNTPNARGNTVFIWRTPSTDIPSTGPDNFRLVPGNEPDGSDQMDAEVTSDSYLLAYAVGSDVKNCCATAFIPAADSSDKPTFMSPSVSLWVRGSSSVSFNYTMPGGTRPLDDGDWAGLWQGQSEAALYTKPPTWFVRISRNEANSNGAFTNVKVLRGQLYTIGYFKGGYDKSAPKQSTLACSTSFTG